ncbi:MAG: STAS domain-containing protein [Bacteroidota bacterium]
MNFEIIQETHYAIVKSGVEKLDAGNAPDLKAEFVVLNKKGINNIILDLSKTRYCDSSGLSAILMANRLCKDTNGSFAMCSLQEPVSKMIRISQLDKILKITADVDAAIGEMTV